MTDVETHTRFVDSLLISSFLLSSKVARPYDRGQRPPWTLCSKRNDDQRRWDTKVGQNGYT